MLLRHPKINMLFTDVDMPGDMDGLKLAASVRNRWPPIRLIVTSALRAVTSASLPVPARFFPTPYNTQAVMRPMREMGLNSGCQMERFAAGAARLTVSDTVLNTQLISKTNAAKAPSARMARSVSVGTDLSIQKHESGGVTPHCHSHLRRAVAQAEHRRHLRVMVELTIP
ncbi:MULTISPECIES: response regulator transcription factor [Rhizobium/Agrobacterium group]|uniref:response regulator transcription factor n=1 Tax=Rhizobium/Agrobacterium group TaxID=227290 RepID=UPI0002FA9A4E|nr:MULTISPECIES: response regulator [Rhizobium/Agrobacterium group]NSX98839.1 response regulator [Agrobacterium vitis]NSZ29978.1 response regulator [Agrobacterium vitis]NSZ45429.1 response regulator [Agrobacterium vitis]NSZ55214.1 response regulator [Agrobacterium vitis]NTA29211.1 response regulator [Allorhizobium ampelinum]